MKRVKFLLVFVFLLIGTLTVLAYTSEKYQKVALANECYLYVGAQVPSLYPSQVINTGNWDNMGFPQPSLYCPNGFYLCAICFNGSLVSLSDAMAILQYHINLNAGSLPPHGATLLGTNGKTITVYRKADIE